MAATRKPRADEGGWVITYYPGNKELHDAFITIAFCGIYLEALLHLLLVAKGGADKYPAHDRKTYEEKLLLLGCSSPDVLEPCKAFREARRELLHEKAHMDSGITRMAQDEAQKAFEFIQAINAHFKIAAG